jgi:two-component system, chemotaxis family, sensor kinase CheA
MIGKHHKYTAMFVAEATKNLHALGALIAQLKESNDAQLVNAVFRSVHTLKGNAAGMGFSEIAAISHELENVFSEVRKQRAPIGEEAFKILERSLLELHTMVLAIREPGIQINNPTEIGSLLARLTQAMKQQMEFPEKVTYREVEPRPFDPEPLQVNTSDQFFSQEKAGPPDEVDTLLTAGEISLHCLIDKFRAVAAHTAGVLQKNVVLKFEGADLMVGASILPTIDRVLLHLIRNAIAHGIEPEHERKSAGKDMSGTICILADRRDENIRIEVTDDGVGLDYEKIKQVALANGIISPQGVDNVKDEQLSLLIFNPGFSTVDDISFVVGRGAGMDIVKTELHAVGGAITVKSDRGRGTSFTFTLPADRIPDIRE